MPIADKSVQILASKLDESTCSHYISGKTFVFPLNLEHNYYHFHHNNMIRLFQSMVVAESDICAPNWNEDVNASLNERMFSKPISTNMHIVITGKYDNLGLFKDFYKTFSDFSYHTIQQIPENTCFEYVAIRDQDYGFWHKDGEGKPGDFRHLLIQNYANFVVGRYSLEQLPKPTSPHVCMIQRNNNRKIQNLDSLQSRSH
jgi:hypothetical protein